MAAASELLEGSAGIRQIQLERKEMGREGPAGSEKTKQVRKQRFTESERKKKLYSKGNKRNRLSALKTTQHGVNNIYISSDLTKTRGSRGWGGGHRELRRTQLTGKIYDQSVKTCH